MKINFSKPSGPLLGLLYFFALFLFFFVLIVLTGNISTYGVNKTVGWAWEIMVWMPFFTAISIILYVLAYLILLFLKVKISKTVSIINMVLIMASVFLSLFPINTSYSIVLFTIPVLSVLILFVNIGFAVANNVAVKRNAS